MINIRHIITAAVAMLCSLQLLAMNDNRQPDFAFPAQVAKNAGIKLREIWQGKLKRWKI